MFHISESSTPLRRVFHFSSHSLEDSKSLLMLSYWKLEWNWFLICIKIDIMKWKWYKDEWQYTNSMGFIPEAPKTMALGGVATGNMKA